MAKNHTGVKDKNKIDENVGNSTNKDSYYLLRTTPNDSLSRKQMP
jgi:hypothetical protein